MTRDFYEKYWQAMADRLDAEIMAEVEEEGRGVTLFDPGDSIKALFLPPCNAHKKYAFSLLQTPFPLYRPLSQMRWRMICSSPF